MHNLSSLPLAVACLVPLWGFVVLEDLAVDDDEVELVDDLVFEFLFFGGLLDTLTAATSSADPLSGLTAATVGLDTAAGSGALLEAQT